MFVGPSPGNHAFFDRTDPVVSVGDDAHTPLSPTLTVWPSPYRSGVATITLADNLTSFGSVGIFDIRGRQVRRLALGVDASAVRWDGAATNGRPVAPGVYYVKPEGWAGHATTISVVR